MGGLIYVQYRGILDKKDLLIVGTITIFLLIIASLFSWLTLESVSFLLISGLVAGAGLIAVTSLFKLIYQLLSSIF